MAVNNSRLLASQLQKERFCPPRDSYRNPVSTLIGRLGHLAIPEPIAVAKGTGHTDWLSPFPRVRSSQQSPARCRGAGWGMLLEEHDCPVTRESRGKVERANNHVLRITINLPKF